MTVLVTDTGFGPEDWTAGFADAEARTGDAGLDLASDIDPLSVDFDGVPAIRVDFPSFADGRGFSIARQLRLRGFAGRLRARGHVLADQYGMARRVGFDEVEIDEALADRQPEDQWIFRSDWQAHNYQARLRG
ncbi:MAG: oxidoreductase [Rhodobacteraceae bacterium]|nr:oxidoreductase [Paracoccaceae bacterium]MAY44580.1 oxidoreductase [Paracoccaceae bacterium]QEW21273.1 hypothetical protein LA6_003481 [Marinibacterium anthonyi]